MDKDKTPEELANMDGPLKYNDFKHLTRDQKEELADLLMINVNDLPTAKSEQNAEMADELDEDLKRDADVRKKYEEDERLDDQRERQLKRPEK